MSFRKYGGTQFASSHNIVKSNVNTTGSFYVTENVGQPNTYINFESDISGNIIIYGDLDVSGNLSVTGDIECSGNVNVSGDVDVDGKLHVQEDIDCSGNVNIDGNIDCIGDITANEFFITGPIDSAPNSVVPKSYVDSVAVGLTPLAPCVLCSNVGNIPLFGYGQTIDGFTISSVYDGSFVLINAQGGVGVAAVTNGVYIVGSTNWQRPTELENGDKATGTAMLIKQGVVNAGKTFVCTSGSDTIPAYIGTSPVLWHEFLSPYSLGQGLNKTVVNGNTVINVDSSLNFINFLDNTAAGPNQNILNIGTNTPTVNVGSTGSSNLNLGANMTGGILTIGNNSATTSSTVTNIANGTGQQGELNIGNQSSNGRLINIGGTAAGAVTTIKGHTLTLNSAFDGSFNLGTDMTSGNITIGGIVGGTTSIDIGNGTSQTGAINLGAGASGKPITIGSVASTVNVRGTTNFNGNVGIGTTTPGYTLDVSGNGRFSNSIYLYNGLNNSVINENGSTLNLINNNADGNVVISNSTHPNNNISFVFDTSGNKITFKDGNSSSDTGFIRWYAVTVDTNSYLQIGTTDNATSNQEKIYFTQFEYTDSSTYARMRIDTAGVWINPSGDANFSSATTYSLNVNGSGIFSGPITNTAAIPATNDNSTRVPTTSWVQSAISVSASKWTTEPNTNNIYYNNSGGFVGIGTTNPQSTLDVSGNARIRGRTYFGIDNPGGGADDTAYMEYVAISGENTCLKIVAENDSSPGQADNIALMPSANVGIGTTTPQYLLDVSGNGNFIGIKSYGNSSTAANNPPDFNATTTNNHNLVLVSTKTGSTPYSMALGVDYTDGFGYINVAGDGNYKYLCLQTRGGNVGIGTTSPAYPLDVNGKANITLSTASNTNPNLTLTGGVAGVGGAYLQFIGSGSGGENVGINLDTFSGRAGGPATTIRSVDNGSYSGNLQFLTANSGSTSNVQSVSMVINPQATGNAFVGIGTSTPQYPLDVSGNSGTILTLQNNALIYTGGQSNILFNGAYELGSITTQDLGQSPNGTYYSAMTFNVQWNTNLIPGISITGIGSGSCVIGINNPAFNTLYALDVSGGGNFTGYVNIGNGLGVTGGLTSNDATVCTGILTANGGITATAGIGTTTLTASGLITALSPGSGDNSSNVPTTSWVNTAISGSSSASKWTTSGNDIYNNNSGNVGIGTTTPGYPLDVSGNTRIRGKTYFGIDDPGGGVGDTAYIEYVVILGEQTTLRINVQNDTNDNINLNPTGNVGINTDTPAYKLDVNGNVGATSYNTTSDYRIKKDVVTLDETFTVDKLRPVTYNNTKLDKQDIGLIAHELEEIYPFLVNGEKDGENFQTVNYTGLIGILIKEIQELKERVKKLEEK